MKPHFLMENIYSNRTPTILAMSEMQPLTPAELRSTIGLGPFAGNQQALRVLIN